MESKKTRTVSLLVVLIDRDYKVVIRSRGCLFSSARDCLGKWMPNVEAGAPFSRFHVCLIQSIPTNYAKMCWQSLLPVFTSPSLWRRVVSLSRQTYRVSGSPQPMEYPDRSCYGGLLDVHGRHSGTKCIDKLMSIESSRPDTSDSGMQCDAHRNESQLRAKDNIYAIRITNTQYALRIYVSRLSSLGNFVGSLADLPN